MKLSEIIKSFLQKEKISLSRLSEISEINKGTLSLWVNEKSANKGGKPVTPSFRNLQKLAGAMRIDTNVLLAMMDDDAEVSWDYVSNELPDNIYAVPQTKMIPMLGSIACGVPSYADQQYSYVDGPLKADFCLTAKGDSMVNARIQDGDIVFCHSQETVENGEIAVVIIDDEATLKRFYRYGDTVILRPENAAYQEMIYTDQQLDDIRIIGKAITLQTPLH